MRIDNINSKTFKGYDVMPLRGLYMQGLRKRGHEVVFEQMKAIAKKENLKLYLNSDNETFKTIYETCKTNLSLWGQDCLAFIKLLKGPSIILNSNRVNLPTYNPDSLEELNIIDVENLPRGGNFYLGYNNKGERWLIINSMEIKKDNSSLSDKPTQEKLINIFEIKPDNILILDLFNDDLDEVVRPIKYPYILVNDWEESLKNVNEMIELYPKSQHLYFPIKNYIQSKKSNSMVAKTEDICKALKDFGFLPIKIAGRYHHDINYMNALAWENSSGNISYLTNSVKNSYQELEFLEKKFEKTLKERINSIDSLYFISGGPRTRDEIDSDSYSNLVSPGFSKDNVIMDLLAVNKGGIHCLTAEIPEELFEFK